jgi:hypothetical protein
MSEHELPDADDGEANNPRTLFVTDAELIRRIGVPEKIARAAIQSLDHNPHSGFPKKQRLWGNRRYWPAVVDYFDLYTGRGLARSRQGADVGPRRVGDQVTTIREAVKRAREEDRQPYKSIFDGPNPPKPRR